MSPSDRPTFWRDRPVLVTGATGLVGSWVVKRLLEWQASVVCLVRDWVPHSALVSSGDIERTTVVRGDLRDQESLERIIGEYEIDTVIHLAAQTIVGIANRNPLSTLDSNIRGTWLLLEACRRSPTVKQIIIASSDKAYGDQPILPYCENVPLHGKHPYDVSKSCADLIAQSYASTYGLPVAITRCGNFFGGGDLNWNRLVPGTIRSVLNDQRPIIRSDGTLIRDYFYVEDGVDAYLLLAEALSSQTISAGEAFNFSYEQPLSVVQMSQTILQHMSSNLSLDIRNEASNEIRNQYLDATKAHQLLGWKPRHSLDTGLEKTITWYRNFFENDHQ